MPRKKKLGRTRRTRRTVGVAVALAATVAGIAPAVSARADAASFSTADDGAQIVQQTWLDSHTFDLTVQSPDLGTTFKQTAGLGPLPHIRVIVPNGWTAGSTQSWPVLYAYHGGADNYTSWTRQTDIEATALKSNVMVVMPEGGTDGSYTDWYHYGLGGTPKWESWDLQEVFQLMERNFHASSTNRAAMGLSSGGGGVLSYAAMYPGTYKYVASFSGLAALTPLEIQVELMTGGLLNGQWDDPFAIWGIPIINQANWNKHDPYQNAAALRGTGIYMSSGTTGLQGPLDASGTNPISYVSDFIVGGSSELFVGDSNNDLINKMQSVGIRTTTCTGQPSGQTFSSAQCLPATYSRPNALSSVTTDIYSNGWHQWAYWQVEMHKAWPLLMASLGLPG